MKKKVFVIGMLLFGLTACNGDIGFNLRQMSCGLDYRTMENVTGEKFFLMTAGCRELNDYTLIHGCVLQLWEKGDVDFRCD